MDRSHKIAETEVFPCLTGRLLACSFEDDGEGVPLAKQSGTGSAPLHSSAAGRLVCVYSSSGPGGAIRFRCIFRPAGASARLGMDTKYATVLRISCMLQSVFHLTQAGSSARD